MTPDRAAGGPAHDCALCPRLAGFRTDNRTAFPAYFNAPVPSFGAPEPWLLVVGLAPGLHGANRTGRPFTGDYAGDLLYETLSAFGLARGAYGRAPDDGLELSGCRIANAVRCVPPENKPTPAEAKTCLPFLTAEIAETPSLRALLALGAIAHNAVLSALERRKAAFPFAHGAVHELGGLTLFDSYHCSRYNTNTRRLTPEMFRAVFAQAVTLRP
ncbi:uracil-DNA glycosylase [Oleispirillum naphthae]|uniref:uracil-DNA glycosylase n=1 Tax=Oleispirillum naphthae TaxID=2838853 RepID=UPI003082430A